MAEDEEGIPEGIPQYPDDRPDMKFLNRYVRGPLCAKDTPLWKDLGIELLGGGSNDDLNIIKNNNSDVQDCCSKMFQLWLERQSNASWRQLIQALKQLKLNYLATQVEANLKTPVLEPRLEPIPSAGDTGQVPSEPQYRPLLTVGKLRAEFNHLLVRICRILSHSSKENLEGCKQICGYMETSGNGGTSLLNREKKSAITNCSDFRQLFDIMRQHISWDEHSILSEIIDECGSDEAEKEFTQYTRKMAISKALEIISSTESDPPPGFDKFIVIINKPYRNLTVDKYKEFKEFIFKTLNVYRHVANEYIRVLFDSLHLEWHVTTQAVPYMIEMAHKQRAVFITNYYVFMKIGKEIIIGVEKLSQKEITHTMLSKQLDKLMKSLNPEDQVVTLSTLRKIFDNIICYPNNDKYRRIKLANKTFSSKVWQYPAGQEFIKMAGWIVQDDHVGLTDDSLVLTTANLLKELCTLPSDQHGTIINAALNGDTNTIEKTLNLNNVSIAGVVYFQNGSSFNLLKVAVATHNMDIVNLLVKTYSFDIYIPSENNFTLMFEHAPESFTIEVLKVCGIKASFTLNGFTLLHMAVMFNCAQVVHHLITEGVDVNTTDKFMRFPLHYANLFDHKEIADYLLSNGADVRARDHKGRTPLDCIGGDPELIIMSQYIQNKQRIHMKPYSAERLCYLKLINSGIDEESAISHATNQFPSIKEKEDTQTQSSSNHAAIQEEIVKYFNITSKSISYGQLFLIGIEQSFLSGIE